MTVFSYATDAAVALKEGGGGIRANDWVSRTLQVCSNYQWILLCKDNSVLSKDNSVLSKDNSLFSKDNSFLSKDNSVLRKENSVLRKDNSS